jgi:predicted ATPase
MSAIDETEDEQRRIDEHCAKLRNYCRVLAMEAERITYLGPFRPVPERFYRFSGGVTTNVGFRGAKAPQILAEDLLRNGQVLTAVGDWFATYMRGWALSLDQQGETFSIVLRSPHSPSVRVNLADVGTGIAQVLPIVVQRQFERLANRHQNVEIIEQPELHLHPSAHGDLADLYVAAIKSAPIRFIIETHSENFVLRLRRRIAAGELSHDSVALYWVCDDGDEGGDRIRRINIDARGDVSSWPTGVFSEDFEEVKMIRREQGALAK